jgi:putative peptidoglycan lipid II flippase
MPKTFRNIAVVSLSTVGSRLLGLVRDILIFAALGAGLWNSAFILAFTLPNLFRRLFGEGALTSAIVPVFSDVLESKGESGAFRFFNQVLIRLVLGLAGIVLGVVTILVFLDGFDLLQDRWDLGGRLAIILMPYMLLICVAAILSAGLNVMGRFAAAAITPVLLNLAMIAALLIAWSFESSPEGTVYWLCGGVMAGGLLQLALPASDLFRRGWRPSLRPEPSPHLEHVRDLLLPGLMGAAILQINILVSRLFAYTLDDTSVSVLYLASRLMELPLGVFTISVVTVFFPMLARAASVADRDQFANCFNQGLRLILAITIPAGVGLSVLAGPILQLLFEWGAFDPSDVAATVPLLVIYAIGLPLYSVATFATRGLHARKDMRTPVRVAVLCLLTNAVSGFILMQFLGAAGLAVANVLAAFVQAGLLWRALAESLPAVRFNSIRSALVKIVFAACIMGAFCTKGAQWTAYLSYFDPKLLVAIQVALLLPSSVALYFGLLALLRFEDLKELNVIIRRKLFPTK